MQAMIMPNTTPTTVGSVLKAREDNQIIRNHESAYTRIRPRAWPTMESPGCGESCQAFLPCGSERTASSRSTYSSADSPRFLRLESVVCPRPDAQRDFSLLERRYPDKIFYKIHYKRVGGTEKKKSFRDKMMGLGKSQIVKSRMES